MRLSRFIVIFCFGYFLFFPNYIFGFCCDGCSDCVQYPDTSASSGWKYVCESNDCVGDCFLPGTKIASIDRDIVVEKVKAGDVVKSFENGKIVESKVSQIFERERDFYFTLKAGDYEVKASAEHPFYVGFNEFKEIQYLKPGDKIYVMENDKLVSKTVTFNTRIDEKTKVYNMTVDNTHTFFANGFAVHNKKGACIGYRGFDCPAGTVRSNIVEREWCNIGIWTCSIGNAQEFVEPGCNNCHWVRFCVDIGLKPNGEMKRECSNVYECSNELIRDYQCVPICAVTVPTSPVQLLPLNGAVVSNVVNLTWSSPSSWGTNCTANNYSYFVRVSTSPSLLSGNVDTSLASNVETKSFTGVVGQTYYWRVSAVNGSSDSSLTDTIQSFKINSAPTYSALTLKNSSGTTVSWDTGNKNHICKSGFTKNPSPKLVTFQFTLTDEDGGNNITAARMLWNGVATNLTLGAVSGNTVIATATVNYTGINNINSFPIQVEISDTASTTGWISTGYTWKVWNCNVPVTTTIYDGSSGQACNTTGFALLADAKMGYTGTIYKNMSGGVDQSNTLDWADSYLPLVNGGDILNPNGNLSASGRFTRLIDLGVGTTICPSGSQFNTGVTVSPYSASPSLKVDLSFIRNQENWFQGRGVDIRSKNEITSGIPITSLATLSADNLSIGTSNNGIVSSLTYKNTNGWNDNIQYGFPNNWYINKSIVDGHKYDYQALYNDYYSKLGVGVTGITNISTGDTGILFVNGNLNINSNVVVPANKYLMVIASGIINIGSSVTQVDGIFVANGGIMAIGTASGQLTINGALYAANGSNIRLARSFSQKELNNTVPAVVVNYRPDMIFALPGKINKVLTGWKEN
ncbi:MAG: Hint domain-containing protein [Candidatus Shapirobacteria bacterium]